MLYKKCFEFLTLDFFYTTEKTAFTNLWEGDLIRIHCFFWNVPINVGSSINLGSSDNLGSP